MSISMMETSSIGFVGSIENCWGNNDPWGNFEAMYLKTIWCGQADDSYDVAITQHDACRSEWILIIN